MEVEEESQGNEPKTFIVRVVSIDYYMSPPIPDYDICYSSFQGGSVREVPVIRVYGPTPAGQKACIHIHRALPYLYIPCSEIPLHLEQEGIFYENGISLAFEKALKLKGNAGSKRQHVHGCSVVRARRFYGYHSTEDLFIKLYLYYPHDVSRAATLLLGGEVFEKSVQPYESHIPFLLQFMVDYNLYGMGHMHLAKTKFRHPLADSLFSKPAEHFSPESIGCKSSVPQADGTAGSWSGVWRSSTISADWMWPYSTEPGGSSNHVNNTVKRQSTCELEGDTTVDEILNQQLKMYTSLSQTRSDLGMVQSLIPIWEEEFGRSGVHEAELLADPSKPPPQHVLETLSNGVEYQNKLREFIIKAEFTLLTMSDDVKSRDSTQCLQGRSLKIRAQNTEEQAVSSSEDINRVQLMGTHYSGQAIRALSGQKEVDETSISPEWVDPKGSGPEDADLLKWLASSQAAEDINSDDELRRETILNPLLPAATLHKVLEKASTEFENESQQECQDILDSLLDVLPSDGHDGKGPTVQDKVPEALSGTIIPQLDGAGDDQSLTPTADSSEEMSKEWLNYKRLRLPHGSSSSHFKRRKDELQWGCLPFSEVQQMVDGTHSAENEDTSCSSFRDSKTLVGCSVRDLMRKKRSFRVESSEIAENEQGSENEKNAFLPTKLEFHIEKSGEQNMHDFEVSPPGQKQIDEQTNLSETGQSFSVFSPFRTEKEYFAFSPSTFKEKEPEFATLPSRNSTSCVNKSDLIADETYLKAKKGVHFVDETLRQTGASSSHCLPTSEGKSKICIEDDGAGQSGHRSSAPILNEIASGSPKETGCPIDQQFAKAASVENHACGSAELGPVLGWMEKEADGLSGYITMTFHKKPPILNWKASTPEDMTSVPVQSYCSSLEDESDTEGNSVKGEYPDAKPFFSDSYEGISKQIGGRDNFFQSSSVGVPTHYGNDGSYAYLLTPAVSPPSVDSVITWLTLQDKGCMFKKLLPESSHRLPLNAGDNLIVHEELKIVDAKGCQSSDEPATCLDEMGPRNIKAATKFSQEISQISGPSGQSKPTPLSQIGFRDPASMGAGQQLTLLSIEVQAESRGDLRPDPQHDAINIIVLAVQNDICPSVDIHVLLRGGIKAYGRNIDSTLGCKVVVYAEETDLIDQFINMTRSIDPDILMGWDIQGNSLGFLAERASHLGVGLLNKISRTPSDTKAVKRNLDCSVKGNADAVSSDSLISDATILDNTIIEDEWGRTHASGVYVSGRIVLNVWRLVRGEVKLNMYTLEAVAEAVLRRKVPSVPWKILNNWFSSGPGQARFRCIDYVVERAKLNHDIVNQLDMVNRTSELARVFGIDFFSVLSRGSQYRVESMLVRLAHTQNYVLISPGSQQVASQPAMECVPLVMEPESGFYSDPVIVLDFQSLYPSMIIAYNLCFSTCLGNVALSKGDTLGVSSYSPDLHILKDLYLQILVTPNGVMYVPAKVRRGVLPRLLEEILSTRIMVKKAMKKLAASQRILYRIFNARQLALKLIANVTYGYTAAGFSGRMPCAELADSIVQCGRRTLEHAISVVNTHVQWNARVIYGDTDSMFVLLKGRTLKQAFQIGNEIASTITAMNPNPVTLKMEKVYKSCFLLTKKRYVGYSYESLDQRKPIFDAKGIETVRRDTCGAVAKTMEKSLITFFEHQDIFKVRAYLQRQWSRILSGRVSLQDFVFAKEVRLGTYSTRTSASLPPAAIVANKAMRADPRAEPRYAERVPYVVVHGEPGARLVDMVVDPQEVLAMDSPYRLNDLYYITKQIIPALQRVFGLVGADLSQWFQEMPRQVRDAPTKHHFGAANALRARIDHYYSSRHCVLCGELVQATKRLCEKCSKEGPVTAAAMTGRTAKLERDIQHLVAICRHCGGGDWLVESGVKCTSLACSIYYERRKVQKELKAFSTIATEAGFYPKCVVEWF